MADNRLGNASFDDSVNDVPCWRFRCTGHEVRCDPEEAVDGPNYLAAWNGGGADHDPSVAQEVPGYLRHGGYKHVFSVYIRSLSKELRKVRLTLFQQEDATGNWIKQIQGPYEEVADKWEKHSVQCHGGGGCWLCEVYWFDTNHGEIRFDNASFYSFPD